MSLDKKKRPAADKVDCELAKRGVWLVKVPRYLSEQWEARAGQDVGRLIIKPPKNGKTDVVFKSRLNVARSEQKDDSQDSSDLGTPSESSSSNGANVVKKGESCEIPTEHNFIISDINSQTMAVLCEDKTGLNEDADLYSGKLNIEGRVVKRADCRPPPTLGYLKLKISQFEKSSQPKRQIQQIEKAEVKFKPIAIHMESIARERQKKEGAKTVRADKDVVRQAIFNAFEKHQYYRLIDLQKLTNQPPGFVKEILTEIAVYNTMPPHKSMWELKPEYRSYGVVKDE